MFNKLLRIHNTSIFLGKWFCVIFARFPACSMLLGARSAVLVDYPCFLSCKLSRRSRETADVVGIGHASTCTHHGYRFTPP